MGVFTEANEIEMEVYDALKTVIDPELGVNIIDLGLVYKIEFSADDGILIELTLSTKNCPMGDVIMEDIEKTIQQKFPYLKKNIQLVWEPAWTPDFVTPEGKKILGFTA